MITSDEINRVFRVSMLFIKLLLQQVSFQVVDDVRFVGDVSPVKQLVFLVSFSDAFVKVGVLLFIDKLPLVCARIENLKRTRWNKFKIVSYTYSSATNKHNSVGQNQFKVETVCSNKHMAYSFKNKHFLSWLCRASRAQVSQLTNTKATLAATLITKYLGLRNRKILSLVQLSLV